MFNQPLPRSNSGFTLIETLVVILIIGILSAIIAPGWLSFLARQSLNVAQDRVYQAMRQAQSNAKRDKVTWQASFREVDGRVQLAVHSADVTPSPESWQLLEKNIYLDNETNLPNSAGVRRVLYNYQGCPVYSSDNECTQSSLLVQGRLTLSIKNGGKAKRCVIVSTLLGALRSAKEEVKPDKKGRYCY